MIQIRTILNVADKLIKYIIIIGIESIKLRGKYIAFMGKSKT